MKRNFWTGGSIVLTLLFLLFNTLTHAYADDPQDGSASNMPTSTNVNDVKCQKGWVGNGFPDLLKYCYDSHGPYDVTVINAMAGDTQENKEAIIDDEDLIVVTKTVPAKEPESSEEQVCPDEWMQFRARTIDICFYTTRAYFIVVIDHSNGNQWESYFSIPGPKISQLENSRGKVKIEAEFGYLPVEKGSLDPNFLARTEKITGKVTAVYSYYGMLLAVTKVEGRKPYTALVPLTNLDDYPSIRGKWPQGFPASMKVYGQKPRKGKIKNQTLNIP